MRAITGGGVRTSRAEALAQLVVAHAATGSGAAALADLFDRARTFVDHRVDIAVTSRVTHTDDHRLKLIMHFKTGFVKRVFCGV
jgi:hypothetical protein